MATSKSATKSYKQAERRRVFNLRVSRALKSALKDIKLLIAKKDKAAAEQSIATTYKAIDKAAKRGVIKKNNAARKKSRLMKAIANIK
jgi:small subunit ribosomal protein S20